jgi:hypothetical protein
MGSVPDIDTNLPTISREAVNRSGVPRWGAGNPSIIVRFAEAGPDRLVDSSACSFTVPLKPKILAIKENLSMNDKNKLSSPQFQGKTLTISISTQLAADDTEYDLEALYTARLALCRRLYEEGFSEKDVVSIHGIIDRMMILPRPLMVRFRQDLLTIEKEKICLMSTHLHG